MKRNVFAIILTLALAVAMVLVISPAAKADESVIIQAQADGAIAVEAGKILDLNGFDVTVAVDDALCVIDSKNTAKTGEGENVGTVKNTGAGVIVAVSQDPATKMRYLAVENGDDTYSAHPFNMTISQLGLNTVKEAICVRASFMANDKVIALIEDYGISVGGVDASAKNSYPFAANMIHAYADLTGSLASDAAIDTQKTAKAYVKIGGETVYSTYEANVTPREVLKTINKSDVAPTDTQLAAILELANYSHLSNLFTRFTGDACQHQGGTATCTAAAVCIDCDAAYGTSLGHSFGTNNPTCGVCGTENPDYVPPVKATITNWLVSGAFVNDQMYANGGGTASGPQNSCDASLTTKWNPQVHGKYADEPGIVYILDGWYDLAKVELTFDANNYYFEVLGSSDGVSYSELAVVDAKNAASVYSGNVASVAVSGNAIRFVRIVFTGRGVDNTFISLFDTAVFGQAVAEPEISDIQPDGVVKAPIVNGELYGTYSANGTVANSFDGNESTKWSPTTHNTYNNHPGVIYTLGGAYDLVELELNFKDGKKQFFTVLGSSDGVNYTTLATVGVSNLADIYLTGNIATVKVAAENVRYVKVIFSGRDGSGEWIHLNEISIMGVPVPVESVKAAVSGYELTGEFVSNRVGNATIGPEKSFDGNISTNWNPEVKRNDAKTAYIGEPGIIYTLDNAYDLTEFELTMVNKNKLYFKIYGSSDGVTYTEIGEVNKFNQDKYYVAVENNTINIATVDVWGTNIRYVKVILTGRSDNGQWPVLSEVAISGVRAAS